MVKGGNKLIYVCEDMPLSKLALLFLRINEYIPDHVRTYATEKTSVRLNYTILFLIWKRVSVVIFYNELVNI